MIVERDIYRKKYIERDAIYMERYEDREM